MGFFSKLSGIIGTLFQIDVVNGGPKLKNNAGVLEARNAADSAYATFTAALMAKGGMALFPSAVRTFLSHPDVTTTETLCRVDSTGGAFSFALPQLSTMVEGQEIPFEDVSGACETNTVTINAHAGDTIENQPSTSIQTGWGKLKLRADKALGTWTIVYNLGAHRISDTTVSAVVWSHIGSHALNTGSTALAGIGAGYKCRAFNDLGSMVDAAGFAGAFSSVAHGAEAAFASIYAYGGGSLTERLRVWASGGVSIGGVVSIDPGAASFLAPNGQGLSGRNHAGNANITMIGVDSSDRIAVGAASHNVLSLSGYEFTPTAPAFGSFPYTPVVGDVVIKVPTSSGACTVNLPDVPNRMIVVYDGDGAANTNNITVALANNAKKLRGVTANFDTIIVPGVARVYISDASNNWWGGNA